ncbi:hypothetical protein PLANPX_3071 [Lacipirellula parvula]|uniref:Uncharacterized protein n=1 Tax=Lacipirellula parvula TaxID=2650471 RepID=A0A5K7XKJ1_9BACT|nr:hypothetical protein PLANPX_3071 [Lacipirellula parvula]
MPAKSSSQGDGTRPTFFVGGVISIHELYSVDEAKRRLGWTDSAYRAATRRGLNVMESGKRRYISGQEIIRFLSSESSKSSQ